MRQEHGPQTRSALIRRTERFCDDVRALAGEQHADLIAGVRRALVEPVRIAVVGRVKAGKSTLVNALVGRRVAPTRAGECTRVVTWYRYGAPDRAELVLTDGRRRTLRIDGGLPENLGVPAADVDHLEVHLQAGALRGMTVIDTPGLATATTRNEAATRRAMLGADAVTASSRSAATQADAVLFLVRDAERADEVTFLRDFLAASGELGASAVNAVGVLSHADVFGAGPWDGTDPIEVAAGRARRLAADRAAEVSDVRPVAALLAETARTGRLREADAVALAGLAGADTARLQLWEHLGAPGDVPPAAMTRLFELLGPYGVAAGRTVGGSAERLLSWLEERSGLAALEELIRRRFVLRADVLKADHALEVLDRLGGQLSGAQAAAVRDTVEQARLDPELHPLREVRSLSALIRTAPNSPLVTMLTALIEGADDAARLGGVPGPDPAAHARRLAGEAQARISAGGPPAEAEAARTAARSYLLIARKLASPS